MKSVNGVTGAQYLLTGERNFKNDLPMSYEIRKKIN